MNKFLAAVEHYVVVYLGGFITLAIGSGALSGLSIATWKSALLALGPVALKALYQLVAQLTTGTASLVPVPVPAVAVAAVLEAAQDTVDAVDTVVAPVVP